LEYLVAQRAEQDAESSHRMAIAAHRLNSLAAFFLPLATISAILEVDPGNIQRHIQSPLTMAAIVLVGLVMGVILMKAIGGATREKPIVAEVIKPPVIRSRADSAKRRS
jgi:hypothetical protein